MGREMTADDVSDRLIRNFIHMNAEELRITIQLTEENAKKISMNDPDKTVLQGWSERQ
jgi:hypothetical protein